jgi:hypothetical protein
MVVAIVMSAMCAQPPAKTCKVYAKPPTSIQPSIEIGPLNPADYNTWHEWWAACYGDKFVYVQKLDNNNAAIPDGIMPTYVNVYLNLPGGYAANRVYKLEEPAWFTAAKFYLVWPSGITV